MRISTKGRYALRMLVDLAEHRSDGYISLKDIAERQNVSKKYLEQIVPAFNRTGILQTNRGFQGGYKLAVEPSQCSVGEIIRLTEGTVSPLACIDGDDGVACERSKECSTLFVWQGLKKVISDYLDGISLQDILDKNSEGDDYII